MVIRLQKKDRRKKLIRRGQESQEIPTYDDGKVATTYEPSTRDDEATALEREDARVGVSVGPEGSSTEGSSTMGSSAAEETRGRLRRLSKSEWKRSTAARSCSPSLRKKSA